MSEVKKMTVSDVSDVSDDLSSYGFNGRIKEIDTKYHCPSCGRLYQSKDGTNDVFICPECNRKK